MTREQRDAIALTKIEDMLDKQIDGKLRVNPNKLAAARIRYDKLRPALSAVDQTIHNADDALSEEQIMARFSALITAYPDLLDRLVAARDATRLAAAANVSPELSTDRSAIAAPHNQNNEA